MWVYTVGFQETLRQPELIIFDTPYERATTGLYGAYEGLKSGELQLLDGAIWAEDDAGKCILRKVHPDRISGEGWFTLALHRQRMMTGEYAAEAYQIVLADRGGRLPWEQGYDEEVRRYQPALYLPPEADPASEAVHRYFA